MRFETPAEAALRIVNGWQPPDRFEDLAGSVRSLLERTIAGERTGPASLKALLESAKHVTVEGQRFLISGAAGDPYFENVGKGATNRLFARTVALLRPQPVLFDVGANIGVTTSYFLSARPGGTAYCYEPDPRAYDHLLRTIFLNGFARAHPVNAALGREAGHAAFAGNPVSASASHLESDQGLVRTPSQTVEMRTLDGEAGEIERLDLIKIDVEGFEYDVITGAAATLRRLRPLVLLEFNSFAMIAFKNTNPRAFLDFLLDTFPHVYQQKNDALRPIRSSADKFAFIHENLVTNRCVDDLLCAFEPVGEASA